MFDQFVLHASETAVPGAEEVPAALGGISMLFSWGVIFAIFYFFIIRPQRQKDKKHREMLKDLKEGDNVISAGGIKGEVISINDEFVQLRVDKGVKLNFKKESISSLYQPKV